MAHKQEGPVQLDQLYRQLVPNGPLPTLEKRWETVLSSSNPAIAETGMAIAQEFLAKGQLLSTFAKFAQSTNEILAGNALRSLTNFADKPAVLEEFKKGSVNSLVKLLVNIKFRLVALRFLVNFMRTENAVDLFAKAGGVTNLLRLLGDVSGEELNIALLAVNNFVRLTKSDNYATFATSQNYQTFYKLLTKSKEDNDTLQILLRILCTLASDEKNRNLLLESKCITYVVNNLLKSTVSQRGAPLKEDILTLLANVLKDVKIADEVIKLGGVKLIFDSLSDPNEDVKTAALAAVANFAFNVDSVHKTQELIVQSTFFKHLIELLKRPSASNQIQLRTVWAISNLMVHEDIQEAFKNVGGIKAIVAITNANVSEEVKLKALSAIFHMSMYYDSMRRSIVENGGLKVLTSILRTSTELNLRQEACRTMVNLSLTDENEGDFIIEKSVPPLIDILSRENHSDIVRLALMTLENLSLNPKLNEHIRECGGVKTAIKLISLTRDTKTQEQTARLIGKLALNSKSREEFQKNNGLSALRNVANTSRDLSLRESIQMALNNMSVPVVEESSTDTIHGDEDFKEYAPYIDDEDIGNNTFAGYKLEEYRDDKTASLKEVKRSSRTKSGSFSKVPSILMAKSPPPTSALSPPPLPSTPPPPLPSTKPTVLRSAMPKANQSSPSAAGHSALHIKTENENNTNSSMTVPIRPPLKRHSSQPTLLAQSPSEEALAATVPSRSKDDSDLKVEQDEIDQEEDYGLKRDQYLLDESDTKDNAAKRKSSSRWKRFSTFFSKMFRLHSYRKGNYASLRQKNVSDDTQVANPCITVLYDYHEYWCEGCKSGGVCIKKVNELRLVRAMLIREHARKSFRPLRPHTVNITSSSSSPQLQRVPSAELNMMSSSPNTLPVMKTKPLPIPKPDKLRSKPLPKTPTLPRVKLSSASRPNSSQFDGKSLTTASASSSENANPNVNATTHPTLKPNVQNDSVPSSPKKLPDNMDPEKLAKAKRHFKRTKIAQELLVTEGTYVKNLAIIIKKFQNPLLNAARSPKPFISEQDVRTIFSCIEIIYSYNTMLLEGLNARMQKWTSKQKIADVFIMMGDFLKMYTAYINNYGTAWRTMRKCRAESPRLAKFLEKTSMEDPICAGLDLESYLIMPVQRTPRYQLLLQQLKDHTEPEHPDYNNICLALEKVIQINNYLNERQREFEDRAKLIEAAFEFVGAHADEIVRPHRTLIHMCKVELLIVDNKEETVVPAKIYLFNDMIILAKAVTYKGEVKYQILHLILLRTNHILKAEGDATIQIIKESGEVIRCRCTSVECDNLLKKHTNLLRTQANPRTTLSVKD